MTDQTTAPPALATYLNDHLAGSVAALDLLAHLEESRRETPAGAALAALRGEIEADQQVLTGLMERLGVGESGPRQAAARLTAKLSEAAMRLGSTGDPDFLLLEGLEALLLGIRGKQALWETLATVGGVPDLRALDLGRLTRRAVEQQGQVERLRLDAGRACLGR